MSINANQVARLHENNKKEKCDCLPIALIEDGYVACFRLLDTGSVHTGYMKLPSTKSTHRFLHLRWLKRKISPESDTDIIPNFCCPRTSKRRCQRLNLESSACKVGGCLPLNLLRPRLKGRQSPCVYEQGLRWVCFSSGCRLHMAVRTRSRLDCMAGLSDSHMGDSVQKYSAVLGEPPNFQLGVLVLPHGRPILRWKVQQHDKVQMLSAVAHLST